MRRFLSIGILILAWTAPVWAAVAHDGEANKTSAYSGVSSVTLSGKTTAGSNRLAVIGLGQNNIVVDSVTYGGSAATIDRQATGAENRRTMLAHFVAPATTSSDVVINFASTAGGTAGASSFNGVDQTTPVDGIVGTVGQNSGTATQDVTSATDDMVVDAVAVQFVTVTIGAGQTSVFNSGEGAGSYEAGATTVTMSWTLSVASGWNISGMNLNAAAAAGGSPKRLLTLGIGSLIPLWPAWWRWRRRRSMFLKESSCDASLP